MADPFLAQIVMFAGNFNPRGWAYCSGQLMSIAQYTALFSLLGTTYGGDGEVTFGLPDLRGRYPRGSMGAAGPGLTQVPLGQKSGSENRVLTTGNLPAHNHSLPQNASDEDPNQTEADGAVLAAGSIYHKGSSPNQRTLPTSTENTGGGQQFSILDPFLGMNYIIAVQGVFPST